MDVAHELENMHRMLGWRATRISEMTVPQRLCLDTQSVRRAKLLAIGNRIYHCIKLGHSDIWDTAVQQNSYNLMHELVLSLARHFADEFVLHHGC